jgi:hypothetical protein
MRKNVCICSINEFPFEMVIQNILLSCALIVIIETAFIKPIITG